ncbi:hypothetical protein Arnit_0622 [Arcobacter nitrofigilis DSM 7299]|uniref:Uncharacterized protein n=1 Tax=Arcobacter nitrofigilis (strain ATCC 33309 / DSM 7299 / CCUG 15893 / LMG 7604 / NCTC 12251 / CI) TaxID=572480 RepID=D5V254_ARCNC|nr:hypothetical protein [Arcobacter nitrofigilis]ADG92287.1 hypothetical protein Arnit_0622 [Arcobacter nitrofigilis DSM 7299]
MKSVTTALGINLKNISSQINNLLAFLNTSKDLINSYASSANSATTRSTYDEYVSKYTAEKQNFETLLSTYEELGGKYNISLEKYNTLTFSEKARVISYKLPNPKDKFEWLAGGEFYNQKNPGGYVWSATNPLAPDEKPSSNDLGYVINKGNIHPYLNEGFTEVQSEMRGFEFLDLLGDYRDTQVVSYGVTLTVVTSGGTFEYSNYVDDTSGIDGEGLGFANVSPSNMGVTAVANIMSMPGMDLRSLNAMGFAQYTITNMINGKTFTSPKEQIGNMISSSLFNTAENIAAQKTTIALSKALGIKSTIAMGIMNIGLGMVIGEFMEIAIGYDNSFGFGGEIVGAINGKVTRTEPVSFTQGVSDLFNSVIGNETKQGVVDEKGNFLGSMNPNYGISTFGNFSQLSRGIDSMDSLNGAFGIGDFDAAVDFNSTFGGFKAAERNMGLDDFSGDGDSGSSESDFGSSNNPGGGVGASGRGEGGVGGFGGGM